MANKTPRDKAKLVTRLKRSPAYQVAYNDFDFLSQDYSRPFRLQLELMKPEILLQQEKIRSTIVVFGGTRIVEPKEAREAVRKLENRLRRQPDDARMKKELRIAKSILAKSHYYDESREFGRLVSQESQLNHNHEFVIITGGGPGVMEAANRGAFDMGAKTIGMNITLPLEQQPNPYITPELCFQFHYFAIRKMHFMLRAKALVAFPGGYGTLDELFEALTLVQTKKVKPLPIVLFGENYWRRLINFDYLVQQGTIAPEDVELFVYTDKAADAWNYIKYFHKLPNDYSG